jgi:hypothetical protein
MDPLDFIHPEVIKIGLKKKKKKKNQNRKVDQRVLSRNLG